MRVPAVVVLLLVAVPAVLAASSRTESYVALGGDVAVDCELDMGIGGACFDIDGSESSVVLTIRDDQWAQVGGYWSFRDGPDTSITREMAGGKFCQTATAPVPWGAVTLHVYVGQATSSLDCPVAGFGTTGVVVARFS